MFLREKDKKILISIFRDYGISLEVWAYGSRITGGAHDGSDLDLVLRTPALDALPIDDFFALREKIRESNIPLLVDLHDWARLPERFHQNILQEYEVLYSPFSPILKNPDMSDGKKKQD